MDDIFNTIVDEFNTYANETDLDIQLKVVYYSELDGNKGYNGYDSTLAFISSKNNKYDLFAYDPTYINIFSPYLLDLNGRLPKELIDLYSIDELTLCNNERLGLNPPKTWDELIDTAEEILNKERTDNNNDELIGYNGFFPENENSMCSIYQFLYSYRDTKESPIPEFNSKTSVDALNKLLEIRKRISSNEIFEGNEQYTIGQLMKGNMIFASFYTSIFPPNYSWSVLPGKNKGVNGSVAGGWILGINKFITDERKEAALKVMNHLFSDDFQKEVIIKQTKMVSALFKLYEDKDCCKYINCDLCNLMKEIQIYYRPSATQKNYHDFSGRAVKFFYQFLNGDLSVDEVLNKIKDITKIYTFEPGSFNGALIMILLIIIGCSIIITTILLFIPSYKNKYFKFISIDLWIIYTLGSVFMLTACFQYFNEQNKSKCLVLNIFSVLANSFVYIPILYKLIINFPKINKYSILIENVNNIFEIEDINLENDNENFQKCTFKSSSGKNLFKTYYYSNIILYIAICFLIFLEWNMTETFLDLRHITFVMILNGIILILNIVIKDITIYDYVLHCILQIFINLIFVLMNHTYMFIGRVIFLFISEKYEDSEDKKISNEILQNRYNNSSRKLDLSTVSKTSTLNYSKTSEQTNISKSNILSLHYATSKY
ncbi:hypothetical protein PIROE2DRAFT_8336 [Piromyces sp. E2]|nr:hypothetical protein PIROE2DRAFT_8336 [Piromyces sp. E2]|eukprot:OUM64794.1 hypothetical protein PIROE2DRAFT_8336 [Piromyces sp. E2]